MLHSEWDRPRHSQFEFALKYEKGPNTFFFLIISEPGQTTRSKPLWGCNDSGCSKKIVFNNTASTVKSDDFRFSRTCQFSFEANFCPSVNLKSIFSRLHILQTTNENFQISLVSAVGKIEKILALYYIKCTLITNE